MLMDAFGRFERIVGLFPRAGGQPDHGIGVALDIVGHVHLRAFSAWTACGDPFGQFGFRVGASPRLRPAMGPRAAGAPSMVACVEITIRDARGPCGHARPNCRFAIQTGACMYWNSA